MGLETGTVIDDLNELWPLAGDPIPQGDDHLRLIKAILKTAFPDQPAPATIGGAFNFTGTLIPTFIGVNQQVALAGFGYTGAGVLQPNVNNWGIQDATSEGVGQLDIRLTETGLAAPGQLCVASNFDYGPLGGGGVATVTQPFNGTHDTSDGWIGIFLQQISTGSVADPVRWSCSLFHHGRND